MNNSTRMFVCLLLILSTTKIALAQECPPLPPEAKISVEKAKKRKTEDYKGWREVSLKDISIYIPEDLKVSRKTCYEGNCDVFESNDISMLISRDAAAAYPRYEKTYPSYKERAFCIDGRLAWFWSLESEAEHKYHAGGFFYFKENKWRRLGIYLNSKSNKDMQTIAEKIIKSVEFVK